MMKVRKVDFEKEDGKWYVVFPEWGGPKEDLQMILGADDMLDELQYLSLKIQDTHPVVETLIVGGDNLDGIKGALNLPYHLIKHKDQTKFEDMGQGKWYGLKSSHFSRVMNIWLCDVTQSVLGSFPKEIIISPIV